MSDNIGGVFLTLLTWMMGILLGLNALWFGWQVNQVNDYNTQVGQMISKEGGYDRVSGWNAAELSAQSYHNHFALYSWVPGNEQADNRPVKGFTEKESVTQAHGDRIRYRIKAQIPLIALVPKFKWTQTFDETVVSNAGNHSPNHAGLRYRVPNGIEQYEGYMAPSYNEYVIVHKVLPTQSDYQQKYGDDWPIHYASDAYAHGFLPVNPWEDVGLSHEEQLIVAILYARMASSHPIVPGISYPFPSQDMSEWPYVSDERLQVPNNYLNGYSSRQYRLVTPLQASDVRKPHISNWFVDWANDASHTSNGSFDSSPRLSGQRMIKFAPVGKVSLWRTSYWNNDGVYRARVHQLTGWGSKHPAGEVAQAN